MNINALCLTGAIGFFSGIAAFLMALLAHRRIDKLQSTLATLKETK